MNILMLILGIVLLAGGVLMVIFPEFFVELSLFGDNQFLYWIGFRKTFNSSKLLRTIARIAGICIALPAIVLIIFCFVS